MNVFDGIGQVNSLIEYKKKVGKTESIVKVLSIVIGFACLVALIVSPLLGWYGWLTATGSFLVLICVSTSQILYAVTQRKVFLLGVNSIWATEDIAMLAGELIDAEDALAYKVDSTDRERIPTILRMLVIERDGCMCSYCGGIGTEFSGPDDQSWHIDHVIPISRGGPTRAENLTLSCRTCNLKKGDRPANVYLLNRKGQPYEPTNPPISH